MGVKVAISYRHSPLHLISFVAKSFIASIFEKRATCNLLLLHNLIFMSLFLADYCFGKLDLRLLRHSLVREITNLNVEIATILLLFVDSLPFACMCCGFCTLILLGLLEMLIIKIILGLDLRFELRTKISVACLLRVS